MKDLEYFSFLFQTEEGCCPFTLIYKSDTPTPTLLGLMSTLQDPLPQVILISPDQSKSSLGFISLEEGDSLCLRCWCGMKFKSY